MVGEHGGGFPVKLYDSKMAPNPRRVRIYLAEKGIEVPVQQVDIVKAESRQPAFLAKNPMGTLPVLELDDGTCIAESIAICRYFDAAKPEPPLFGTDARDRPIAAGVYLCRLIAANGNDVVRLVRLRAL